MSLRDLFEPEELVGRHWHRLIGGQTSYPRHQEAAVTLEQVRTTLAVFFHGIGGDPGLQLAAAVARDKKHRLSLLMKLGMDAEKMETASRDPETLTLPARIDVFPQTDLNRRLYLWLAAYLAHASYPLSDPEDPYRADLQALRRVHRTTRRVLAALPGLSNHHKVLCDSLRTLRPKRSLPREEQRVEDCIQALLGGPTDPRALAHLAYVTGESDDLTPFHATMAYKSFLPVPLWGEVIDRHPEGKIGDDPDDDPGDGTESEDARDGRKFAASRQDNDQAERDDPLILDRFEKILAMAEMVNVNRPDDDEGDKDPLRAAEDLDELTISHNDKKTASKIKLDLDLPAGAVDPTRLLGVKTFPEWDYRKKIYHPAHCRVLTGLADDEGEDWTPDDRTRQRIRKVRRQFEALRPKRERVPREMDGRDLDVDALIRSRCDLAATGEGSDRIFVQFRNESRDLAALILVDVSLSTDAWMEGRRVLDVEKEALTTLTHGLAASGDDHAVYTFTSRKRNYVRLDRVKDFDEPVSPTVTRRIGALKPGYYTRMGPALRFATEQLNQRPNRHRLLLLISDGKPNDLDHYEGRYGIEDTRMAIREARQEGLAVFGVTVDTEARDYFPYLFGRGGCAIVSHMDRLTMALPAIFRHLVA
ncbi:nitric oxide reductase activation protein NorD [Magnetospira sp. QH-2]|uniref:nitric oxide reductase activation protein NorD n=1 Tax=Magnetospira sp. (strain QH-2) TaxID=1288970 RepID=UPI0003E81BAA|nr:VWA domain-containing protein [Magnetospira sp. QH-2]CCQ73135.1 NorD protein required for nitric oxide reductase activity [Magnetospira sp. QH-2]